MIEKIRNISLFDGVSEDVVDKIVQHFSSEKKCQSEALLIESGKSDKEIFFLLSGKVRLSMVSAEGVLISYRDIEPNDYFGWLSALHGGIRSTSAVALQESSFITMNADKFHAYLMQNADIRKNFFQRVGGVVERYTERVQDLTLCSSRQRVFHEIQRRFHIGGNPVNIGTHEDLASWVGVSRETVSRALSEFEKAGVLLRQDKNYFFKRDQALENLPNI